MRFGACGGVCVFFPSSATVVLGGSFWLIKEREVTFCSALLCSALALKVCCEYVLIHTSFESDYQYEFRCFSPGENIVYRH